MAKVLNKYRDDIHPDAVYIGRPTIFGNPFALNPTALAPYKVATREEAIEKYREYFTDAVNTDPNFAALVEDLRGMDLYCFCKPLPCHGDVILEYLERTANGSHSETGSQRA